MFQSLKKDLSSLKLNKTYVNKITFREPDEKNNVPSIDIELANENVEHFTFYREREKQYIVDFWLDVDTSLTKKDAGNLKKALKVKTPKKISILKRKVVKPVIKKKVAKKIKKTNYRDFRYGAAFIWDYAPMAPQLKSVLRLDVKTPEFFYPIKNRDYDKSEKEAHLQLNINLYRKKKYGLMYKSIKLFSKKFGYEDSFDINEYLKANAILRDNFKKGNTEPVKTAISMFHNVAAKSDNYDLRKGIYKYLISYYMNKKELYVCYKYKS